MTEKEKNIVVKLVILAAIFIGLVYGGERFVQTFTQEERTLFSSLQEEQANYRTRLSQIQDEERLQNQYVEAYSRYRDRGLIYGKEYAPETELAAEQDEIFRLTLLERLQEIQTNRRFFDLVSTMRSPENLPSSFSEFTADSEVAVRTNLMKIEMPMLHSLDMLMMLNDFYDEESNRFVPVECSIVRTAEYTGNTEELLNADEKLLGSCDLVWLTVFDPLQGEVTAGGVIEEAEGSSET